MFEGCLPSNSHISIDNQLTFRQKKKNNPPGYDITTNKKKNTAQIQTEKSQQINFVRHCSGKRRKITSPPVRPNSGFPVTFRAVETKISQNFTTEKQEFSLSPGLPASNCAPSGPGQTFSSPRKCRKYSTLLPGPIKPPGQAYKILRAAIILAFIVGRDGSLQLPQSNWETPLRQFYDGYKIRSPALVEPKA